MSRLIAFGCSLTKGAGLPDIYDKKTNYHNPKTGGSKYAWPQIIANLGNFECINLGYNASSNKLIANNILDFQFEYHDLCIIMWTFPLRHAILDKNKWVFIHPTSNKWKEISDNYYKHQHNSYDAMLNTMHYIMLAKYHLDRMNIKTINLSIKEYNVIDKQWFKAKMHNKYFLNYAGVCEDGYHPSIEAHKKFGNDIWENIINS